MAMVEVKKIEDLPNWKSMSQDFLKWADNRSVEEIWRECPRGDWLMHLAILLNLEEELIYWATLKCIIPSAMKYISINEKRPYTAVDAAYGYLHGFSTLKNLRAAIKSAWDAEASYSIRDNKAEREAIRAMAETAEIVDENGSLGCALSALSSASSAKEIGEGVQAKNEFLYNSAEIIRKELPYYEIESALIPYS